MKCLRAVAVLGVIGSASVILGAVTTNGAAAAPKPVKCAPNVPGVTATTINVGGVAPRTGAVATTFAGFIAGAGARFAYQNAKGINGRTIQFTLYDDAGAAATQTAVGARVANENREFGIVSVSTVDTMFPALKAVNMPVTGWPLAPAYGNDRNVFGASGAFLPEVGNTSLAVRLRDAGVSRVAVINHSSPGATASGDSTVRAFTSAGIPTVLRISSSPFGAHDATSEALRVKSAGADGVWYSGFMDGAMSLAQAMRQQGAFPRAYAVTSSAIDQALLNRYGPSLDGAISMNGPTTAVGVPRPGMQLFEKYMADLGVNPYDIGAPLGFVAADLFIEGLRLAGKCPTRQAFIDKLRAVDSYDGGGLLPGPISFRPGLTPNGSPATCLWYFTYRGTTTVPDPRATCGQLMNIATGQTY